MAPSSVLYALCLVILVTAYGRRSYVDSVSVAASNTTATTYYYDVSGLITLINRFPQLSGMQFPAYTNDPCYPQMLSWIACSNDYPVRRVTALYLEYQSLSGILPDFSDMDALETIELQGNNLRGSIPEFLGYFPRLTYLNLAYNYFTGRLPYSLVNNNRIILNVAGNYGLCSSSYSCSPPSGSSPDFNVPDPDVSKRTRKKLVKILAGVIPASILAALAAVCACCCRRKKEVPPADTATATAPV